MIKLNDELKLGDKTFTVIEFLDEPNTGLIRVRTHYGTYALVPMEFWEAAARSAAPSDRLLCPVCQTEGRTSVVREKASVEVKGPVDKYYDEDGAYHFHDPSYIRREYECDQHHRWDRIECVSKCWCGWKAEEDGVIDD